jgi:hypothetical protein
MKKSKIKSDHDARHMPCIKIRDSIMAYAIHLEFGHNLADYFRKHPQYANTSVASIQANLQYLLKAVPDKLDPPEVRQAAFEMFHPDIQRIMIHRNSAIAEHEYPPVEELLDAAADAERSVEAEVRIAGQIRNARPAPTDETVLMLTGPPAPRPALQARIEPVEEEDLDLFPDLNTLLVRGVPSGDVTRPNPAGQVFLTLAMPDPDTALAPDPRVQSNIPLEQQQAVVFAVAADLAQQPCLDSKVQVPYNSPKC